MGSLIILQKLKSIEHGVLVFTLLWATCVSQGDRCNATRISTEQYNATYYPVPYMVIANRNAIQRVNLDETQFETLISNSEILNNTVAIDFDIRHNYLFWSDVDLRRIMRSNLDGTEPCVVVDTGVSLVDGIAWDWLNEKLYWTDTEDREIEVMDIDTMQRRQLIDTGSGTIPRDIVLDPNTRYIYWTDWGDVAKIERAFMDGSGREILHQAGLVWPNGITIDYESQTLYWVDAKFDRIESSDVDGRNRRLLFSDFQYIHHPFATSFYKGTLFWSDTHLNKILYAPANSLSPLVEFTHQLEKDPLGIKVIAIENQPINTFNPCDTDNGGCSYLCLLGSPSQNTTSSLACLCPNGMVDNGTDCTLAPPTTPPTTPPTAPPTVTNLGSCRKAGHTDCCVKTEDDYYDYEICQGSGSIIDCYCDISCLTHGDCCYDFQDICDTSPTTATTTATEEPIAKDPHLLPSSTVVEPSSTQKSLGYTIPQSTTVSTQHSPTTEKTAIIQPSSAKVVETKLTTAVTSPSPLPGNSIPALPSGSQMSKPDTTESSHVTIIIVTVVGVLVLLLVLTLLVLIILKRRTDSVIAMQQDILEGNKMESYEKEVEEETNPSTVDNTDSGVDFKLETVEGESIV